jgi:hypothetical protein
MPVQGEPSGPLKYAPPSVRQPGTARASTASPPQELQYGPPQVVTSLRGDRGPGVLPGVPPSRDVLSSHGGTSLRASGTGSAPVAAWKRKKRSPKLFEGDAALKELRSRLAAAPTDQTPAPHLAPPKTPMFASVVMLMGIVGVAAAGALGFVWITSPHGLHSPNLQAGKKVAPVSQRETPRPAAENVAAERAPDPSAAAEQPASAALYQEFLKWRQLRGR